MFCKVDSLLLFEFVTKGALPDSKVTLSIEVTEFPLAFLFSVVLMVHLFLAKQKADSKIYVRILFSGEISQCLLIEPCFTIYPVGNDAIN